LLYKKIYRSDSPAPELNKKQILFLKKYQPEGTPDEAYVILCGPLGKYIVHENKINGMDKSYDTASFIKTLYDFKEKYGDRIVLPAGFVR